MSAVVSVEKLHKRYRLGLRRKLVEAVRDVSFEVNEGEIFGFVGPNGAGKTTTLRAVMGLIRPTSGGCKLFGIDVPNRGARKRLGFLPESPYFHEYLSVREMLDLAGRLFGLPASVRKKRGDELIGRVGLAHAANLVMRKYSKGMLQRAGLAQALINDPELVILDEPMSGLDPVGRKEVRDLILELRDAGKTIFFSTHILHDVETICDRVAMIVKGRVQDIGPLSDLIDSTVTGAEVVLSWTSDKSIEEIMPDGAVVRKGQAEVTVVLSADANVGEFVKKACDCAKLVSVNLMRESLEDLFVRRATSSVKHTVAGEEGEAS